MESKRVAGLPLFKKKRVRWYFVKIIQVIEKFSYVLIGGELKIFFGGKTLVPLYKNSTLSFEVCLEKISSGKEILKVVSFPALTVFKCLFSIVDKYYAFSCTRHGAVYKRYRDKQHNVLFSGRSDCQRQESHCL